MALTPLTRRARACLGAALAIACMAPLAAGAQGASLHLGPPPGVDITYPMPDAAVAESIRVLRDLETRVRAKPNDAATWHHVGMLAWLLMYRDRTHPYKGIDWTLLGRQADTALRLAHILDPENARYRISMGQFFLGTGPITTRVQSYVQFDRAYETARNGTDPQLHADAAIERGRVIWRRYEDEAHRSLNNVLTIDCAQVTKDYGGPVKAVDQNAFIQNDAGQSDYTQAEALFREAYEVLPADPRAFRQLAMVYAEKNRWNELAALATDRVHRLPNDNKGWFALGLALLRRNERARAEAAFDTALARSDAAERAHMTNVTRVLAPDDSIAFVILTPAQAKRQSDLFWLANDPLWSRGRDDAHTEFLAREAYADIRWTVEELGVRGVDSDRGEFYLRWGPPDRIVTGTAVPGDAATQRGDSLDRPQARSRPPAQGQSSTITTTWAYDGCPIIVFQGMPTYATSYTIPDQGGVIDSIVRAMPSMWRNALDIAVAEMPTQIARFRAPHDSIDAMIVVEPPVRALREAGGANVAIRSDFWIFDSATPWAQRDSSVLRTQEAHSWIYRLAQSRYMTRVEVTADGVLVAGRSTNWIMAGRDTNGFDVHGYGVSDPLIAAHVEEHGALRTWRDLTITPTAGSIAPNSDVAIVWENYALSNINGGAKYAVTIVIKRKYKMLLNRIRARIVGAIAAAVGVDRTEDQVIFRFDRSAPYAATIPDHLTIDLGDTAPGEYTITLGVTDAATKKYTERSNRFVIRE